MGRWTVHDDQLEMSFGKDGIDERRWSQDMGSRRDSGDRDLGKPKAGLGPA